MTESTYPPPFFGDLAPATCPIEWSGHINMVTLKLLSWGDEINVARYARQMSQNNLSSEDYILCEALARIARSVVAVDGETVDKQIGDIDARMQWVAGFPSTLVDAIIGAYNHIRSEPLELLQENIDDANFGQAPSEAGSTSEGADPLS